MSCFFKYWLIAATTIVVFPGTADAERTVNAPRPFSHTLTVQPVQVSKTSGESATVFGDAQSELYIKRQVNRIMAQSGIRVDWLPLEHYTDDFAYDGSPTNYYAVGAARPDSHMDTMITAPSAQSFFADASVAPILFVEIPPYFGQRAETSVNGYGMFHRSGIAIHVGENLINLNAGRDLIASVICHELGHNLGLYHSTNTDNLMTSGGSTDQLTESQITAISSSELLRSVLSPKNYDIWAYNQFLATSPNSDDDGDHLTTLVEFLFLTNPLTYSPNPIPLPEFSDDAIVWSIPMNPDAVADGITCHIEVSTNLQSWLPAGTEGTSSTILTSTPSLLTVRMNTTAQQGFMRYCANLP